MSRGFRARREFARTLTIRAALVIGVLVTGGTVPPVSAASPAGSTGTPIATPEPVGGSRIHGAASETGATVETLGTTDAMTLTATGGYASCTGWTSETRAPTKIRVYRTRTDTVETLDFKSYVRKVIAGEFDRTWPFQVLAMGAIAAKQNAWYWSMKARDWGTLATYGRVRPIARVLLASGAYQWQTTAGSTSGAGLCWDLTDNPNFDQCYDCYSTPIDPMTAPRNQAALDATWGVTLRRPRSGVQSFFAPGYVGSATSGCPSMATQADWESWFTGRIDFTQAVSCASTLGESAAMLLRRFLSSALEIRTSSRADLTGDGLGDVSILRATIDPTAGSQVALDPATAQSSFVSAMGTVAPPSLGSDPGTPLARAIGRLDRTDRASLVSVAIDASARTTVVARSLGAPGSLTTRTWWSGSVTGLDRASGFTLDVVDITGDMRPDVVLLERARVTTTDGIGYVLRVRVLSTTDAGADPNGFATWANIGPTARPTRFERLGDVDGDGRVDLVFARGDAAGLLVSRTRRDTKRALQPAEPYGTLALPANPADWRFFALADVTGTGRDEPVIGATGVAAAALAGTSVAYALQTAAASSDPVGYGFALGPLGQTWSSGEQGLLGGQAWTGDVDRDGRAELGIVNAATSSGTVLLGTSDAAKLAIVAARNGVVPASVPTVPPTTLDTIRVVAPGDQSLVAADARLSRLVTTLGSLPPAFAPAFSSDLSAYTGVVDAALVSSIRIRPFAVHPWALITVNGTVVPSGVLGPSIPLALGVDQLRIEVADGSDLSTYTYTLTRAYRPPAPTLTKVSAPLGGLVRVYWSSNGDGGTPLTGWVVQYRRSGTTTWTSIRLSNPAQAGLTISGLTTGLSYEVRVIGRNLVGLGTPSARWSIVAR